jgi:predicted nuclease of restriction endonuclease-like RecB superfamily
VETVYRLSSSVEGERLVLHYLGPRDEPWLRALLEECSRFAGKKQAELRERLQEPLPRSAPRHKLRLAIQVLDRLLPEAPKRVPSPREVRSRVFHAAADPYSTRRQVFERVAREMRIEVDRVEESLFADLASQRRVAALPQDLSPSRLALLTNQALMLAFLKRAERIRIKAWGNTRALIRHAHLLGLICVATRVPAAPPEALPGVALEISGPFALFHKTEVYGRSLASLLPRAARCQHFELEATCVLPHGLAPATLHVSPYDPIFPARELPSLESRVEARFVRDFEKLAPGWRVEREPEPIEAAGTLVFPDLELVHRDQPELRWAVEIIGFWAPAYLSEKMATLRAAQLERFILCIDDSRCVSDGDQPVDVRVLRYKTRVDAAAVLAILGEIVE